MAHLMLKGLHQVKKRGADGRVTWHVYAWRGGPKLALGKAKLTSADADLIAAYQAAHKQAPAPVATGKTSTLADLLAEWQASADWRGLAKTTRAEYGYALAKIACGTWQDPDCGPRRSIAGLPQAALTDPRTRGILLAWRDQAWGHQPRTADKVLAVLSSALGWAVERGRIERNPIDGFKKIYKSDRSLLIWTEQDLAALVPHCSPELRWGVDLAVHTGMAMADLLALPWSAYKDGAIDWRRRKTGREILVPASAALRQLLEIGIERRGPLMLTSSWGRPWTKAGFSHAFMTARDAAGFRGRLRFHDLRGTAATKLLRQGLSYSQVALIMGWDEKSVEQISKRYVNRRNLIAGMVAQIDAGQG